MIRSNAYLRISIPMDYLALILIKCLLLDIFYQILISLFSQISFKFSVHFVNFNTYPQQQKHKIATFSFKLFPLNKL